MNDTDGHSTQDRTQASVEASLLELIRDRLHVEVEDPESELFETGLIDSLGFVDLLMILATEYGIEVDMEDLDTENFRTVRRIAEYVMAHSASSVSP